MNSIIKAMLICVALVSCNLFHKKNHNKGDEIVLFDTAKFYPEGTPEYNASETWNAEGEILFANYKPSRSKIWVLKHTDLDVRFDFEKRRMYGTAYITAAPYAEMQDTLALDAKNLEILSVLFKSPGQEKPAPLLNYIYEDSAILKIIFPAKINIKTYTTICINYISKPYEIGKTGGNAAITDDRGLFFVNHDLRDPSKPRQIWTQGETESNSHWLPTIDAPNQKMTQKITMTVPDTMVTLSNGNLIRSTKNNNQTRTDIWEQKNPHAPYLAMMAVGNWSVIKDKWRGREVNYLVEKKFEPYAKLNFGNTPEMMEFFSNYTGVPFAWDKFSQVVVREFVSGAMENTSATVHMEALQQTPEQFEDKSMEDYVSHELFHQWFGDLVTTESWANITVNESFATYGEYLWRRYKYGQQSADFILDQFRDEYNWLGIDEEKKLVRFDYEKTGEVFDNVSYQKGALILHMLQYAIGEEIFKKGINIYLEKYRFGTAEADDLREAMEEASGKDLHWFWDEWYYGKGHPKISLILDYDKGTKNYSLNVQQTQTFRNAFVFPVKIIWLENGTIKSKTVQITTRNQSISLNTTKAPDWCIFDADNALLAELNTPLVSNAEIDKQILQLFEAYKYATAAGLKYRLFAEAADLAEFSQNENTRKLFAPFLRTALHSNYSFTLNRALRYENSVVNPEILADGITPDTLYKLIDNVALPAESRALAIASLYYMKAPDDSIFAYTSDPSPAVSSRAITLLSTTGKWMDKGMDKMSKETNPFLAQEWAKKLLGSGQINKIEILNRFFTNPSIELQNINNVIRSVFSESNNEEDASIAEYLFEKFKRENKINHIKIMALQLEGELYYLTKEITRLEEDHVTPEKIQLEKKSIYEKIIQYRNQL